MAIHFRSDGWVKSAVGPSVPGAQVYAVLQPANVAFLPPTPLADIFSDVNGLVPITQPVITDGFGHYSFYALPGFYTIVVALGGRIQQVYPDQAIGISGGAASGLVIQINNVPKDNPNLLNFKNTPSITWADNLDGSVTATASSSSTPLVLQTNGVLNANQALLNVVAGSGISAVADGVGGVTLTNISPGVDTVPTNGIFSFPNFTASGSAFKESPADILNINIMSNPANEMIVPATTTEPAYNSVDNGGQGFPVACGWGGAIANVFLYNVKKYSVNAFTFNTDGLIFWIGLSTSVTFSPQPIEWLVVNPPYAFVGFRYFDGVDGFKWHAVAQLDDTNQTVVGTGVSVNTTGHRTVFEIRTVQGIPGTINYLIDGVPVATISSNVPSSTLSLSCIALCGSTGSPFAPTIGINLFSLEIFQ